MSSIFAPVFKEKKSFKLLAMDRGNGHSNNNGPLRNKVQAHGENRQGPDVSPPPPPKNPVLKNTRAVRKILVSKHTRMKTLGQKELGK